MTDYNAVDSANRILDQETDDFHLESLEDDEERLEAEEAGNRREEYQRVCLYLADFMNIRELSPIASRIMHHWESDVDSYYMDPDGSESLFYRGFEITKRDTQWMCEWQDDQLFNFFDADLMMALKDIDVLIEKGGLK